MVIERRAADTRYLEAGSGWPVVLLHAFPVNADMWRPQLERVPAGWRYIAPDLRGDSMDGMAEAVVALLDELGLERAVIGGLSMGGYVTFALHALAPQRFSGIILADTRATADTPQARAARVRLIEIAREKGPDGVCDEMLPKVLGSTALGERPDLPPLVREMARAYSGAGLVNALTAMMNRADSSAALDRLSLATLVLCGDEDAATPLAEVEQMQARIERSRLVVLHGAGHLSNLEKPDEFSRALEDFLSSNM